MKTQIDQNSHLTDYIHILLKRKWIIITFFVIVVTTVVIGTFKTRPVYRATAQLLIDKENTATPYQEGISINISDVDYYQSQYKIMKSRTLARKVIDDLNLKEEEEFIGSNDIVSSFLGKILIQPVRGSRLVNLSAESYYPELAAKMANKLVEIYVKQNLENRFFASREILKKLPKGSSIENLSIKEDFVRSLPSVVNNGLIQNLKAEYINLETQYAELSRRYRDKHPKIISLKSSIEALQSRIDAEIEKIIASVKVELSGDLKANNVRIIDPAEIPDEPVRPNKRLNISLGIFAGLLMGAGLALFFDYMDNTIKSEQDIEKYLNLALIGLIPKVKDKEKKKYGGRSIFVLTQPKSPATESVKSIRSNILFSAPKDNLKVILITSAGPEEGKTLTSTNLAVTFAQYGEKTLLIDMDLRRSSLHKVFKIGDSNRKGMSNCLIGEERIEDVIQKTEIENLDIIFAGPHPPNPAELLNPNKIKEYFLKLRNMYDRIILDSPPVMPVSDSINLSSMADGVIQVVRYGKLSRQVVMRSKGMLADVGAKYIGVILNNIDIESGGHYYYPYQYYYYYGNDKK
ncbi:MAG: hypothetical protein A2252_07370 [Elusimicrobia bacterium RIFOXYA2_FULL_39_19]|nr:MAG: hypothetical protein A2252_07370 [Elusimicrobia bacterium RIFOXYA2_FULL_39_19]